MALFCPAIKRGSVLLNFLFRSYVKVFSREISQVCCLKYPYSCSSHFFFLLFFVVVLFVLMLSVLLLAAVINLSILFFNVVFESSC